MMSHICNSNSPSLPLTILPIIIIIINFFFFCLRNKTTPPYIIECRLNQLRIQKKLVMKHPPSRLQNQKYVKCIKLKYVELNILHKYHLLAIKADTRENKNSN